MPLPLDQALDKYDPEQDREHLEAAERERADILARFPLDGWPEMLVVNSPHMGVCGYTG